MGPHLTRDVKSQQAGLSLRDRYRWGGNWRDASYTGSGGTTSGRGLPEGRMAERSEVWWPLPRRWLSHRVGARRLTATMSRGWLWVNLHGCRLQATQGNRGEGSRNL